MTTNESHDYEADATAEDDRDHIFDPAKAVKVDVAKTPKSVLAVRFEGGDIDRLREMAERAGLGVTQLVREWTLDALALTEKEDLPPSALAIAQRMSACLRDVIEILRDQPSTAK
jgi:hypothetical protein